METKALAVHNPNQILLGALIKAKLEFPETIVMDKTVDHANKKGGRTSYKYASMDAILPATTPILALHGLLVIQTPSIAADMKSVSCSLVIYHSSGISMDFGSFSMPCEAYSPKNVGAALTYCRRYQYNAVLGLSYSQEEETIDADDKAPPEEVKPPPILLVTDSTWAGVRSQLEQSGTMREILKQFGPEHLILKHAWPAMKTLHLKLIEDMKTKKKEREIAEEKDRQSVETSIDHLEMTAEEQDRELLRTRGY